MTDPSTASLWSSTIEIENRWNRIFPESPIATPEIIEIDLIKVQRTYLGPLAWLEMLTDVSSNSTDPLLLF